MKNRISKDTEAERGDLLEVMADMTGCLYISDLRFDQQKRAMEKQLRNMNPEEFSIVEWNELLYYITGEKIVCSSQMEALKTLLNMLGDVR